MVPTPTKRRPAPSAELPRRPYLLGGPFPCPLGGDERIVLVRLGVVRRVQLDEVLDVEAGPAQESEQLAMREPELVALAGLLDAIHAAQRSLKLLRYPVLVCAEVNQRPAADEDEAPARTKQAVSLRYPAVRVGEQRRSVPGVSEVERGVEQVLIERFGLGKDGGSLLNKINSISSGNSAYNSAVARGRELLNQVGF